MPVDAAPVKSPDARTPCTAFSVAARSQHDSRRRIGSEQIFLGSDEIEIDHAGALYRLRITSLGKLILTK